MQHYPPDSPLTEAEFYAISIDGPKSPHVRCNAHAAMLIRSFEQGSAKREACKRLLAAARADWMNWQTRTQRQWQRQTRRPSRAKHHDSISTREKYVRCHNSDLETA